MGFDFALKTNCTLKMFLLSAENNFHIILTSYVEGNVIKVQVWTLCRWLVVRSPKSGCCFGKFTVEQVLKSFSGRNNSLKPPDFEFCDSLPCDLEESIELRALSSWVLGIQICKKNLPTICFVFLSGHYGFTNYFDILIFLFSNIIPGGIPTC